MLDKYIERVLPFKNNATLFNLVPLCVSVLVCHVCTCPNNNLTPKLSGDRREKKLGLEESPVDLT